MHHYWIHMPHYSNPGIGPNHRLFKNNHSARYTYIYFKHIYCEKAPLLNEICCKISIARISIVEKTLLQNDYLSKYHRRKFHCRGWTQSALVNSFEEFEAEVASTVRIFAPNVNLRFQNQNWSDFFRPEANLDAGVFLVFVFHNRKLKQNHQTKCYTLYILYTPPSTYVHYVCTCMFNDFLGTVYCQRRKFMQIFCHKAPCVSKQV